MLLVVLSSALVLVEVGGEVDSDRHVGLGLLVTCPLALVDHLSEDALVLLDDLPPHGVQILQCVFGLRAWVACVEGFLPSVVAEPVLQITGKELALACEREVHHALFELEAHWLDDELQGRQQVPMHSASALTNQVEDVVIKLVL